MPLPSLARNITTKIVVPYAPGGTTDIIARIIQNGSIAHTSRTIIVENKPGVNGVIGASSTYSSPPDGRTIMVGGTDTNVIYSLMYRNPRYDAKKFVPLAPIGESPHILMCRNDLNIENAKDLINLAKKQELSYASWGPSSSGNLAMAALKKYTGVDKFLHVPYTSTTNAMQALMAGQVDMMFTPAPTAKAMGNRVRPLFVYSNTRSSYFPEIPAIQEAGLDIKVDGKFWMGFFAPPGTPTEIAQEFNKIFTSTVMSESVSRKLQESGISPEHSTLEAYQNFYQKEFDVWSPIIKSTGIILD